MVQYVSVQMYDKRTAANTGALSTNKVIPSRIVIPIKQIMRSSTVLKDNIIEMLCVEIDGSTVEH